MSEPKLISPLLDGFTLGAPLGEHHGVRCCPAIKENSDNKYIVKIISVPASQVQIDALVLAGAFKEPEDAMKYFSRICDDIQDEAAFLQELSKLNGFTSYEGWQTEPITKRRLGYEVYLVGTYKPSLEKFVRKNPVTHLQAMNLALDMCSALTVCRQAGSLYVDLKPGNIFISDKKEYQIGDLGFIRLNALRYSAIPEKYISSYTPLELHDPMEPVNLTADTYALGMILYQLYNEGNLPVISSDPDSPLPAPVNADYELAEIILKAIHADPKQRWTEPDKMGQALVAYMQRNVINDTPITPYTPIDPEIQNVQISDDTQVIFTIPPVENQQPAAEVQVSSPEPESIAPEHGAEAPVEPAAAESAPAEEIPADFSEPEIQLPEEPEVPEVPQAEEANEPVAEQQQEAPAVISDDFSHIYAKANDLISHETPVGVILPEIEEAPDPFAFATEDSIEAADLNTPFDPVMDTSTAKPEKKKRKEKKFVDNTRRKKVKKFFGTLLFLVILGLMGFTGLWFYQNIYVQSIEQIQIEGGRDRLVVTVHTDTAEDLLQIACADNYGNLQTKSLSNGRAEFYDLLPNTMYTITVEIDGFHSLIGHTSEVFTTDTTTNIAAFNAFAGPSDGTAVLTFSVDGEEPDEWTVRYSAEGEKEQTITFAGHNATVENLTLGKVYTFTLDAGEDLSISGKTDVTFMASKLILAENLIVTTATGTDMTIRWNSPGDTVVEFWNVRCYNEAGYEKSVSVTDTEVYLTEIDPSSSYIVEVTAAGMTQPARTSITANPINIINVNVDDTASDKLVINWEYTGADPEGGWLFMYRIDGNANLNVIKCNGASAEISPKIPEAKYQFTIQAVDGTSIFDNVQDYTCPAAPGYNANAITEAQISAHMVRTPDDSNWSFDTVGSDAFTDVFELGDPISIVLHGNADFYLPGNNVKILYVIRDAHGNVIPGYISEADDNWRGIWQGGNYHYGELDLPVVPEVAGKYQLNIYIDGASVAKLTFTIQ